MNIGPNDRLLVTGATGLVGSHVVERARQEGIPTRVLVRPGTNTSWLENLGVETISGDLTSRESLKKAASGVTLVVHCAAKVGDWGPVEDYRRVNVNGLRDLLEAAESSGTLRKFVHISSLGVYAARDHYGTDETEPTNTRGIDGYTLTKVESEQLVLRHVAEKNLPAVVLRPGFIYGSRDRTILPRLLEKLRNRQFAFLGSPDKLMNNTYVGNLVDAVFLALRSDSAVGQVYNITDGRLVTKQEFIATIARSAGYDVPTKKVPLGVARVLARGMETAWRLMKKQESPLLSSARIKFLGLNLDFCINKARRELGYEPRTDFSDAMPRTVAWFNGQQQSETRAQRAA